VSGAPGGGGNGGRGSGWSGERRTGRGSRGTAGGGRTPSRGAGTGRGRQGDAPRRVELPPATGAGAAERRAGAADRDADLYAKKRAAQARKRARQERQAYDPAAPDPDAEWTVAEPETDGLRRTTAPSPLGDALAELLATKRWGERLTGATASQRWEQIVGSDLAARCEPTRLAGGTLVVRAESQVWATQLRYLLPQLRSKANEVLGEGRVREIRLEVGPLQGGTVLDAGLDTDPGA
jgi:predicted nucleic acid-binding Zn ribbon protein